MSFSSKKQKAWLVLLAVTFVAFGLTFIPNQTNTHAYDSNTYMALAGEINHEGGPAVLFADCFTGRYRYANGHPLYPVLLSFVASESPAFFTWAKILTLIFSTGTMIVVFLAVRRLFGFFEAAIAGTLLLFSVQWMDHATLVTLDPLFTLFTTLFWGMAVEALSGENRTKFVLGAGAAAGLAFLTKGNGIFLIPVWFVSFVGVKGVRSLKTREPYLFLLPFVILSLPLLWRNAIVYGTPLYNDNAAFLWAETWSDLWNPEFWQNPPGMFEYIEKHGFIPTMIRYYKGMFGYLLWMVENLRPVFAGKLVSWITAVAFVLLGFWNMIRDKDKPRKIVSICFLLSFWYFFAWYLFLVNVARFAFPVLPVVAAYGSMGIVKTLERFKFERETVEHWGLRLSTAILVFMLAGSVGVLVNRGFDDWHLDLGSDTIHWFDHDAEINDRLYGRSNREFFSQE